MRQRYSLSGISRRQVWLGSSIVAYLRTEGGSRLYMRDHLVAGAPARGNLRRRCRLNPWTGKAQAPSRGFPVWRAANSVAAAFPYRDNLLLQPVSTLADA